METKSIEQRIVESELFYFDDGYLGSTNHGVGYYYSRGNIEDMNLIECNGECELEDLILDKDSYKENSCIEEFEYEWDEFFDMWFGDCEDFEVIEDGLLGGDGYGKIVVDKINRTIKIMVVPVLYDNENNEFEKVFGFDSEGNILRIIDEEDLVDYLNKGFYIG